MYGRFTYISLKNQPNGGKYSIHGWYGIGWYQLLWFFLFQWQKITIFGFSYYETKWTNYSIISASSNWYSLNSTDLLSWAFHVIPSWTSWSIDLLASLGIKSPCAWSCQCLHSRLLMVPLELAESPSTPDPLQFPIWSICFCTFKKSQNLFKY